MRPLVALVIFIAALNTISSLPYYRSVHDSPPSSLSSGRATKTQIKIQQLISNYLSPHDLHPAEAIAESNDDLLDLLKSLIEKNRMALNATGNYLFNLFDKKYGIDDELHKVYRQISDIFHTFSDQDDLSGVDSYIITDPLRKAIKKISKTIFFIKNYVAQRIIKENHIDISDCPMNDLVNAPDGFEPLFKVFKYFDLQSQCVYFKVTKDNDTVKNIYRDFFEVTNKLYNTDTLSDEEDREKWERSMSFFIKQVRSLNLSEANKNAVEVLTNAFTQTIFNEKLSFIQKLRVFKSIGTLLYSRLRGKSVMVTLWRYKKTHIFVTTLYPIAVKMGLKQYISALEARKNIKLSSNTRSLLRNIYPSFGKVLDYITSFISNSSKTVAPRYTAAQRNPLQPLHNNRAKEYIRVPQNLPAKYSELAILQFLLSHKKNVANMKWSVPQKILPLTKQRVHRKRLLI